MHLATWFSCPLILATILNIRFVPWLQIHIFVTIIEHGFGLEVNTMEKKGPADFFGSFTYITSWFVAQMVGDHLHIVIHHMLLGSSWTQGEAHRDSLTDAQHFAQDRSWGNLRRSRAGNCDRIGVDDVVDPFSTNHIYPGYL